MKRILLLLLALTCFRFSYGEGLSPEKQQLALDFIHNNMLNHENLLNVFHEDIVINLKGKVIREDSIDIQNIIHNIQKAIPNLKIALSNNPGNLVIWINDSTGGFISRTQDSGGIVIKKLHIQIPGNCPPNERKQLIYYNLLRNGLIIYPKPQKIDPQIHGCVFAENDFNSITFSPFDLFILEKIYSREFQLQLALKLNPALQQTAWNSISAKFLGTTKTPIIYRTDIAVKIKGTVSSIDSTCMSELIAQLKTIIPNRKIFLTSGDANLIFHFQESAPGIGSSSKRIGKSIQYRNVDLGFKPGTSKENRKRVLYYYLIRSLVDFSPSTTETTGVDGCVFDEKKPELINYHPFDAFILNKLYADDFKEQYKNQYIHKFSYRLYLVHMYHNELDAGFFLFGLLIVAISLTSLILKGAFKPHNWNWKEYNKQGLYLIAIYSVYSMIISASDLRLDFRFSIIYLFPLQALLAVNLTYYSERLFLKNRTLGGAKVVIIFLITFIMMTFSFLFTFIKFDQFMEKSSVHNLTFSNIILISLARALYIFVTDRYKSIINQKDVELAQMGELHKQAELQSLRAKINPHFLYNALNSIASLATTDAPKTEQMALALSDFFKYAINREQKQFNSLSEELNAIRTYLEIEKVRFGNRLNFEIDCEPTLFSVQIPQLLIQPLVENAIKHGLSQITENGIIRIVITRDDHQINIRIYDNGPAFPDGPLTGFGIRNTQERIGLLYGSKASISWSNQPPKYIELSLPFGNECVKKD